MVEWWSVEQTASFLTPSLHRSTSSTTQPLSPLYRPTCTPSPARAGLNTSKDPSSSRGRGLDAGLVMAGTDELLVFNVFVVAVADQLAALAGFPAALGDADAAFPGLVMPRADRRAFAAGAPAAPVTVADLAGLPQVRHPHPVALGPVNRLDPPPVHDRAVNRLDPPAVDDSAVDRRPDAQPAAPRTAAPDAVRRCGCPRLRGCGRDRRDGRRSDGRHGGSTRQPGPWWQSGTRPGPRSTRAATGGRKRCGSIRRENHKGVT